MADRVLVIEDDQSIAELIRDYLEINKMDAVLAMDGPRVWKKPRSQTRTLSCWT